MKARGRQPAEATRRDYKQRMLRVLVHIQQHLDEHLELEELARVACFSPYHFHRVFSGMIGESLKAHVRRLRLERAASQLKVGKLPVTEIGLNAGYQTHEAFTRAFKTAFGVAPIRFRSSKSLVPVAAQSSVHYQQGKPLKNFKTVRPGFCNMDVQIKRLKPMRVAFMRHVGPYRQVGETWDRLLPVLGKEGLLGGDTMFIGVSHDDPEVTPSAKIRYDACVTVDDKFVPWDELGAQTIAGGDYAMTTHLGPYNKLNESYAGLFGQWLPRSGRTLRSVPCFEVYLTSPENTEPQELATDVYMPLA